MRILLWHVHGSWTTAFVQGVHDYLVPVLESRGPDGRGRAQTWDWPASVQEVPIDELRSCDFDAVVLQRPGELELLEEWTGRRAGIDVRAVYVEHNTPSASPTDQRHPLAHRSDIPIVHVTHFNALYWDNGKAPVHVIEHGIIDPGYRWSGVINRGVAVINEPVRRDRITGTDLLGALSVAGPVDVFGMSAERLNDGYGLAREAVAPLGNLPQVVLHEQMAQRRVYVHTSRWTSLGLSLLEAMHLGMPVVAVGATEIARAVPPGAGVTSTVVSELQDGIGRYLDDWDAAAKAGRAAREAALSRYGLQRFLNDWDRLWESEVVR